MRFRRFIPGVAAAAAVVSLCRGSEVFSVWLPEQHSVSHQLSPSVRLTAAAAAAHKHGTDQVQRGARSLSHVSAERNSPQNLVAGLLCVLSSALSGQLLSTGRTLDVAHSQVFFF